ncbi:SNF2-related protein [Hyphobacterium sp.]|uniref:SNF2-related protein n=1 Tax=Hyphobacterium sp. TaxID=2004662 RepID=UPI003BAC2711
MNALFTKHHAHYLAHHITLAGLDKDAFAKSLSSARVDMNPHQVEAALFALKSPLAKGVVIADEVGLGKTIEAGMVIAQRWAEQQRRILLIAPASLRKQWEQELAEKFSIPSTIIDAKVYRDLLKKGIKRPFHDTQGVIIASYEFAAGKEEEIRPVPWNLVVFDEAHRLRNVYKKGASKRATALRDALKNPFKILLTATPLQNSLMELFGLVSVIDETHFGGPNSFRVQFTGVGTKPENLERLKARLAPICHRTLRRQVQEAGHINYTARNAITFNFDPNDDERELYNKVSTFLKRNDTVAYGDRANALVVLQVRKILGSSTFAVTHYLRRLIQRLEQRQEVNTSIIDDLDDFDDIIEEYGGEFDSFDDGLESLQPDDDDQPEYVDPERLQAEIDLLKGFLELAESIGRNAKGDVLKSRLPSALDEIVQKGGQRKAVIFTESVRTQHYLAKLLEQNGFNDQIVLLNGSNSDPDSRAIYAAWKEQHKGTDKISGSKTADMKQALVEAFKSDEKSIFIATESGAEGINLQFCSMVVNFDLPWNPQRVEQRIGRCHRYGQKIDVTVVNMLNLSNAAEKRIHELLDEKFRLFDGVFGSSDEILGSIESGVDFEKAVLDIVQNARDDAQIQLEFDLLKEKIQDQIDAEMQAARAKVLEELDQAVVSRLKDSELDINQSLNDFTRRLLTVAKAELPDAVFPDPGGQRFEYNNKVYTTQWPIADENDWQFFRLSDGNLASEVVDRAKGYDLTNQPAHITFLPDQYPFAGQIVDVKNLKGRSGWMLAAKARIDTPNAVREEMITACITDDGEEVQADTADRMFWVPAKGSKPAEGARPMQLLQSVRDQQFQKFSDQVNAENAVWLEEEEMRLDEYAQDLETEFKARIKDVEEEIKELKKQRRAAGLPMEEKLALGKQIKKKEGERDDLVLSQYDQRRKIRQQVEEMLDDVADGLNRKPIMQDLFVIRWSVG